MKKFVLLGLVSIHLLTACTHQQNFTNVDTTNLAQLESVQAPPLTPSYTSNAKPVDSSLRSKIIKDSALTLGAQGGLAWASSHMNVQMEADRKYLDSIFNFSGMMLSHGVIPPVLEEGNNSLNLADPNTIRVADKSYKIVSQARFATTPPNWREYLIASYPKPELPNKTLLPTNATEQKAWREAIQAGWQKGMEQAYNIFQQNLARLKRDFRGMVLYRKLLQERMISPPFVSRTELGVTGNGEDMRINDQVLRIVELPKLQTNSKGWKAVVIKND